MIKNKSYIKEEASEVKKKGKVVSARVAKLSKKDKIQDPMAKLIMGFFDEQLKQEFVNFLQEKSSKVVPITKAKSKEKGKYRQEGVEPVSFKELTSYKNPLFSSGSSLSPPEYNPETIDVDTFTLMRRDHQLAVGLAVIKLPIISLGWTIKCDDENIAKTVQWALNKIWVKLVNSSLMAVDYGFASHEKVWERDNVKISSVDKTKKEIVHHNGDLVYFKKIKPHHPSSIKMKFDELQNLEEIIQEASIGKQDISLPLRKCFLFTHNMEFGNPFGISRLKNAYKVWYWKELLYQFMMQYYERRGTPPTIATAPPGKSKDSSGTEVSNLELALRMATSLISSSVAAIPYQATKDGRENQWKLDLLKDDARGPMFVEALKHLDARCLRAIFVPENVLTQEGGGGYSSSSVHADLFLMSEKGLTTDLEEAVNNQLITPFVEANYPPEKRKPCSIQLEPLDWNRKIALKEIFIEMIRNVDTMVQMGVPPTIVPNLEKMAGILDIPVGTWEEVTGRTQEELFDAVSAPAAGSTEEGGTGKTGSDSKKKKVAGRKKTRAVDSSQTQDRKRINPGGKRADRMRESDTSKKR